MERRNSDRISFELMEIEKDLKELRSQYSKVKTRNRKLSSLEFYDFCMVAASADARLAEQIFDTLETELGLKGCSLSPSCRRGPQSYDFFEFIDITMDSSSRVVIIESKDYARDMATKHQGKMAMMKTILKKPQLAVVVSRDSVPYLNETPELLLRCRIHPGDRHFKADLARSIPRILREERELVLKGELAAGETKMAVLGRQIRLLENERQSLVDKLSESPWKPVTRGEREISTQTEGQSEVPIHINKYTFQHCNQIMTGHNGTMHIEHYV